MTSTARLAYVALCAWRMQIMTDRRLSQAGITKPRVAQLLSRSAQTQSMQPLPACSARLCHSCSAVGSPRFPSFHASTEKRTFVCQFSAAVGRGCLMCLLCLESHLMLLCYLLSCSSACCISFYRVFFFLLLRTGPFF